MAKARGPLLEAVDAALIELRTGLRALTVAELRALGYSPSSRRYTSQRRGIKPRSLKREKTVSYRAAKQRTTGKTLEKSAKERRARRGGRSPSDRYYHYVREFARIREIPIREAQKHVDFRTLYNKLKQSRAGLTTAQKSQRARERFAALLDLEMITEEDVPENYLDIL
jgi:hypothetical protein